jgi:site-specific recombinase XerD
LEALRTYWRERRPKAKLLFASPYRADRGHALTRAAVKLSLRAAVERAGLTLRVDPHLLRDAFATHLLEIGTDLRTVQILLGHRSLQSTTRDTHLPEVRRATLRSPLELLNTEEGKRLG